ncbi:TIGR02757 family protein [Gaoshiqia sp. Z1-71]|uniref:TIGR02757 family protein n=1 Tax=Gaoshiqia hydrogeniformans TaxID=3290090 RepID=UPI003BF8D95E
MKTFSAEIKEFLEERVNRYNQPGFIETDPICIPHRFERKEDIEIAGFLTATIAWGSRTTIIKNALKLMELMGNAPFDFVMSHQEYQLERFDGFAHRTFNQSDILYFIKSLKYLYQERGGMEPVFSEYATSTSTQPAIHEFRKIFFSHADPGRTSKHLSDPAKGSAAKRVNMFLRWMVRDDRRGVDFGIWKGIKPAQLSCPLDVHSGNAARKLGLLTRKQNDARALEELDRNLRLLDPLDPVKFDFALFGLGVFEKF